jgi:hypothetical protein
MVQEQVASLLNPLRREVKQVSADGAYETRACYKLLQDKGCKPTTPPRSNAGLWEEGYPRNEVVKHLRRMSWRNGKRITILTFGRCLRQRCIVISNSLVRN